MKLNEKLKQLRLANEMTQEELSKQLFVSRSLVAKWESGKVYPTRETILKIASYFQIDEKDILDDEMTKDMAIQSHNKLIKTQFSFKLLAASFALLLVALLGLIIINEIKPNVIAKFKSNQGDITIEVIKENNQDTTFLTYFGDRHAGTHTMLNASFKDLVFSPDDRYMVVSTIYEDKVYLEATDYLNNSGMNLDAHIQYAMENNEAFSDFDQAIIDRMHFDFIGFSNQENLLLIEFKDPEYHYNGYFWFDFDAGFFSTDRIKGVIFV